VATLRPNFGSTRRRRADARARLLLVVGTPGTGKRAVGHYLEQQTGFAHLDFENDEVRRRFLESGTGALRAKIAELAAEGRGLVVTWGAGAAGQLRQVRRLQAPGFEPIWFDSDRGSVCGAHFAFGARVRSRFHFVDSFEPDGLFRPLDAVVAELLQKRPQIRPASLRELAAAALESLRPRPLPAPAGRFAAALRWRVAGGLALATGLAGASVAAVVGLHGGPGAQPARLAAAGRTVHAHVARLPRNGVLVSGRSLAGVALGDTMAQVRALWGPGRQLDRCRGCKPAIWFYTYPTGDPVGAGVEFKGGRVVAVFTLGGPIGWHTESGIRVGQVLANPFTDDTSTWKTCAGYSAKTTKTTPDAVTSILTQGAAVYGFALTRPSVSPCQ
jgi:hypothetical protein